MANRVKETEKSERIIRGLLKLPENRRCINCNSLGPQYVCTNFWTFVCTTCSGIHREFTHRVKSVSMAKFSPQEVAYLQQGGNKCARDTYLKEWDPMREVPLDSSNAEKLRDFIKQVYVDEKFRTERKYGRPPSLMMGDKESLYESGTDKNHGSHSPQFYDSNGRHYSGGSSPDGRSDTQNASYGYGRRSPSCDDLHEQRFNGISSPARRSDEKNVRYSFGERSPGYEPGSQWHNISRRSPVHHEIVNDWHREDRFGNKRNIEDGRVSDVESRTENSQHDPPKHLQAPSFPAIRPVREILGDSNVIPLRISEPPKANSTRIADSLAPTQRNGINSREAGLVVETVGSLIDFETNMQPSASVVVPKVKLEATASTNNWASFDLSLDSKMPQSPSAASQLVSDVAALSISAPVPANLPAESGQSSTSSSFATTTASQLLSKEKPTARKELPEDLFAMSYSGWQTGMPHSIGFAPHPPPVLSPNSLNHSSKSTNPFDFMQPSAMFSQPMPLSLGSSAPGNVGLPQIPPSALTQAPALGIQPHLWMPQSLRPYAAATPNFDGSGSSSSSGSILAHGVAGPYPSVGGNPFG